VMPSFHATSSETPIAIENRLAAEAKVLSRLTRSGSADALMP
jgi:hypothetical protein